MNALQKHQPNIIVHTAAMSKPDECENDKAACILHNVIATKFIAEAANIIEQSSFIFQLTLFLEKMVHMQLTQCLNLLIFMVKVNCKQKNM
jgi:dTDP-D-glucose 4,6-dehydratase